MDDHRRTYLRTLNLAATSCRDARKAALDRAHDLRKFEIELYWKRANYFWLLQGAVFLAVASSLNSAIVTKIPAFPILLCALGVTTAMAGYLASLGSKFWQLNWEHHVDMLETEFEGNLYKTVFVAGGGARWSVSKVNERLTACFTIFWLLLLSIISFHINNNWTLQPRDISFPNSTEMATIASWAFVVSVWRIAFWSGKPKGETVPYGSEPKGPPEPSETSEIKSYLVRRGQVR